MHGRCSPISWQNASETVANSLAFPLPRSPSDTNVKSAVALTLHAIAVHSPDTAKAMASEFVSLVFLAMHEQSKEDSKCTQGFAQTRVSLSPHFYLV